MSLRKVQKIKHNMNMCLCIFLFLSVHEHFSSQKVFNGFRLNWMLKHLAPTVCET
jgi:hypothetical protein